MKTRTKNAAVVKSDPGGISAAISLTQEGCEVDFYEKNGQISGKLNLLDVKRIVLIGAN